MTPKQTALVQTLKLFALAITVAVLVNVAFAFLTVLQIGIAFAIFGLSFLGKMVYDLELSKAEHLEALNKMK